MKNLHWGHYKVIYMMANSLRSIGNNQVQCPNYVFENSYSYMVGKFGKDEGLKSPTCEKRMREVRMNYRIKFGISNDLMEDRKKQTWTFSQHFLNYLKDMKTQWWQGKVEEKDIERMKGMGIIK